MTLSYVQETSLALARQVDMAQTKRGVTTLLGIYKSMLTSLTIVFVLN